MSQNETLEEVMQKIRARVAERSPGATASTTAGQSFPNTMPAKTRADGTRGTTSRVEISVNDLAPLRVEIDTAVEGTRRVGQLNPRNPGMVNSLIQFCKKVMRRSLTWYTRPIHFFQGGVIRSLQQIEGALQSHERSLRSLAGELNRQSEVTAVLARQKNSQEQELQTLADKVLSLQVTLTEQETRLSQANAAMAAAQAETFNNFRSVLTKTNESLRRTQLEARLRDRDVRRFLHDLRGGVVAPSEPEKSVAVPQMFPTGIQRETEFDYFAFEDVYRGDEADIRGRQERYLENFRGRQNVLDVGCGRGEFLELLRANDISAKGVELGTDQYLLCKEKGLDVVQEDLFSYLESIPDESLGGLFSAQVIEHLTASDQLRYVALAHQKTMPGSPVIFETINAQCVWAVMRNFFLDPTHVRPMHPDTLKFAMESVRFKNVELHFSSPLKERQVPPLQAGRDVTNLAEFNSRIEELNQLVYGDQDYAAIGWH